MEAIFLFLIPCFYKETAIFKPNHKFQKREINTVQHKEKITYKWLYGFSEADNEE